MRSLAIIDALLILTTLIWGSNFTIVKTALVEMPALSFNAVRLVIASGVFLAAIAAARRAVERARAAGRRPWMAGVFSTPDPLTRRDWLLLVWLGVVGHFLYQLCFIGGLARTSVANSSLILGTSPVAVALAAAAVGQERVGRLHWAGAGISVAGIYIVVARGAAVAGSSLAGDVLMMLSVACWTFYTVGARTLMARHSPLYITGVSMLFGTLLYVPAALPELVRVDWGAVSAWAWGATVFSSVFALCVAYLIWYIAVQQIGNTRTAVYSNVVPLVAMLVAAVWLGEPLTGSKVIGAGLVLVGVALTRVGRRRLLVPGEE
jgi:drug/metabolite transporter (DMT)-like permease